MNVSAISLTEKQHRLLSDLRTQGAVSSGNDGPILRALLKKDLVVQHHNAGGGSKVYYTWTISDEGTKWLDATAARASVVPSDPLDDKPEDDKDTTCSDCDEVVSEGDLYFATPCGSFCEEHMEKHAAECEVCRKAFPEFAASAPADNGLASEVATVLAALRFYQEKGQGEPDNRSDAIHDIATDGGEQISLDATAIDDLCERINCGQWPAREPGVVVIEISDGNATVKQQPDGVEVEIIDYDLFDCGDHALDSITDEYRAVLDQYAPEFVKQQLAREAPDYVVLSYTLKGVEGDPADYRHDADFIDGDIRTISFKGSDRIVQQGFEGGTGTGGWYDRD